MATDPEMLHIFAQNLRRFMDRDHINGNELAARTGASIGAVSSWLNEVNEPRAGMLYKLTKVFNCNPSDLLEDKTKDPSSEENGPSASALEFATLFDQADPEVQQAIKSLLRAAGSGRATQDADPKAT